jgi:RNA polymerase sigma-70 factor, ECF subfamily
MIPSLEDRGRPFLRTVAMTCLDSSKDFYIRLNEGQDLAFEQLARLYRPRLCALVERELGCRFLTREDPEDAVQSALTSFCRGIKDKRFHIDHGAKLWCLLERITRNKVLLHIEYFKALKRNPDREIPLEGDQFVSREPSPQDAAQIADLIERIIEGIDPPTPEILRLCLEGCTQKEIAAKLGITEGRVRSVLDFIRDRVRRLLSESFRDNR